MQSGDSDLLDSCSPAVREGLEFLDTWFSESDSYYLYDGIAFYLLNQVGSDRVSEFIEESMTEEFWKTDVNEHYQELYYICLLYLDEGIEFRENGYLVETVRERVIVSQDGKAIFGMLPQGGALRPLSMILPNDERTSMALSYFEEHLEELSLPDMAVGLLALAEFHSAQYQQTLNKGLEIIEEEFKPEIGFEGSTYNSTGWIAWGLLALVRLSDKFSPERAVRWLEERQNDDGSWGSGERGKSMTTALVLLVLFAAGEGPKAPRNPIEWENRRLKLQEGALPLASISDSLESEEQDEYIERFRHLSPVVLTGVIAAESIVILSLFLIYDPSILYPLPELLFSVITVVASLFTIIRGWGEVSETVREWLQETTE